MFPGAGWPDFFRARFGRNVRTAERSNARTGLVFSGGVAEWLKAAVLKTATRKGRGFESLPLRHRPTRNAEFGMRSEFRNRRWPFRIEKELALPAASG